MKTGIFVGSFDPPTKAHFQIAQLLHDQNIVDEIIFIPSHNDRKSLISLDHRITMLKIYCKEFPYLKVSLVMKDYQTNFNYKILTNLPIDHNNTYIIIGSDILNHFYTFTHYETILANYYIIVIPRNNRKPQSLIQKYYRKYQDKFIIFNYHSNISSSLVRSKLREGRVISHLVEPKIARYIQEEKLYSNNS